MDAFLFYCSNAKLIIHDSIPPVHQAYKKNNFKNPSSNNSRINVFALFVFVFCFLIIFKLFYLQILGYGLYNALASDQHQIFKKLFPERGKIYVHNSPDNNKDDDPYSGLYPAAINKKYNFLYAEPDKIEDSAWTTEKLTEFIDLKNEEVVKKLSQKDDPYEPLMHRVEEKTASQIKLLNLSGINFMEEYFRHYPDENAGGHILGFVGYPDSDKAQIGSYGIEGYFNEILAGQQGFIQTERDVKGKMLKLWDVSFEEAKNGSDVVLTIDYNIQHTACKKIKEGVSKYEAESGTIIVMEPDTGKILGMCSWPDFNPEKYNEAEDISIFNNPAIFSQFEPGSIFKPITAAIALDLDKVKPDSVYEDTGEVKIGPHTIRNSDFQAHGKKTMAEVLQLSLNTGAIYMARQIGKDKFRTYLEDFGFGRQTGIELDIEAQGNINSLNEAGEIYLATASFGQGIAVTPIQIAAAYAALANGGKLPKPYIVDKIIMDKNEVKEFHPQIIKQVISERAAALIGGMLVSVVEEGHAKKAGVKGYYVAGKTGTAQVAENGVYGGKTIHSFAGFAPVNNPKFSIIVKLDNPKTGRFAESTAVPLAHEIIEFTLNYYGVKPAR